MKKSNVKWSLLATFMLIMTPVLSNAMHVMEGFLPVNWAITWWIIFIPFFVVGLKSITKIVKEQPKKKLLLALCGAFVFVLSALKIPSVTGSCSHPTGVGLAAILFGPSVTVVLGTIVLLFQALLLAHGGITTLGANSFSMAIVGPLVSFGLWKLFKDNTITSIQLGLAFPDPSGGIIASIIKFLGIFFITQVPIAIAEGLLTVIIYNFISENEEREVLA